jgi:periplasmic protein CpxP/Spy
MIMEKTKLLTLGIIALFLLNLGTLGFLLLSSPKAHHPPGHGPEGKSKPREIIIEKLHFDAVQINEYDQLIQWHRSHITALEDKIRDSKNELYLQLNENPVNETTKDSLINALASYQKEIEITHFKHFQDIKKLCKKEQLEDFTALTEELSRLFSKPPPHRND